MTRALEPAPPRGLTTERPPRYTLARETWAPPRGYFDLLRRRWLTIVVVFVVVIAGVTAGTLMVTPQYRASGTLEVRGKNAMATPIDQLFGSERVVADDLATQAGILKSVTLADRTVTALHLEDAPDFQLSSLRTFWRGTDQRPTHAQAIDVFRDRLTVAPVEGSRLLRVSFTGEDPAETARVVNTVFDVYSDLRREEAQRSADLLETQFADASEALTTSQRALQEYVRAHGLQVLETGKGETESLVNDGLKQIHMQLAQAQADRYEKQSAYELATRGAAAGSANALEGPVAENLTIRLADLRREAAGLAVTFRDDYPKLRETRMQIAALEQALADEGSLQTERAAREFRAAERRESLLHSALAEQERAAHALEAEATGYGPLRLKVATNERSLSALDQKLKDVKISAALAATDFSVVDAAVPPRAPYSPELPTNLGLAVAVGLLAGLGGAVAREWGDGSIRTARDMNASLGVPALATIPSAPSIRSTWIPGRRHSLTAASRPPGQVLSGQRDWYRLDRDGAPQPILAEAFAALGTAVLLREDAPAPRSLLVTSSREGEGKTTVAVNLAMTIAGLNKRVLLIDADLRRPSVHDALGLENDRGLVQYLSGRLDWHAAVRSVGHANLQVLPAESSELRPTELLSSSRMRDLLTAAAAEYDFVILDSPPLHVYPADVRLLASLTDAALLTVQGGTTEREVVGRALMDLPRAIGVVLNRADAEPHVSYY